MGITSRLVAVFFIIAGTGIYLLAKQNLDQVKRYYRQATEDPLIDLATVLAAEVSTALSDTSLANPPFGTALKLAGKQKIEGKIYDFYKTTVELRVYITDEKGILVYDSLIPTELGKDYSKWNDVFLTLRGKYGARTSHDGPDFPGSTLYVAAPIRSRANIVGSLTVAKPTLVTNKLVESAKQNIIYVALGVFAVCAVFGWLLIIYLNRPLGKLTKYAIAVAQGEAEILPRLSGAPPEVKTLGQAMESMRTTLEGKKYVENYVQTLTHEMKSPLTGIAGAVEILKTNPAEADRHKFLSNIERETARMKDTIDDLLVLARLERQRLFQSSEQIELRALLEQVLESRSAEIDARRVSFEINGATAASVIGDSFWIFKALSNIIGNAIEFSPPGGRVTVEIVASDKVRLTIADDGPGVPEWAIPKVFDRFFSLARPDTGRKSSGLGLAIAKEVIERLGGTVSLANRDNGGVRVTITFKRSEQKNI